MALAELGSCSFVVHLEGSCLCTCFVSGWTLHIGLTKGTCGRQPDGPDAAAPRLKHQEEVSSSSQEVGSCYYTGWSDDGNFQRLSSVMVLIQSLESACPPGEDGDFLDLLSGWCSSSEWVGGGGSW